MHPEIVSHRSALGIALCLVTSLFLTAALSWPALDGPFLFDDFPNLEHLSTLNGQLDWASLANYASLYRGEPGRPLSMLSFVINDFDWPSSPWSFKYTNLMLHLLVGVLIFGLARSLARFRIRSPVHADLAGLMVMLAWLLHPMQLSTSMLVVQRMTQLSVMFTVAGLWSYVVLAKRARNYVTAATAILCLGMGTILATLCKEIGALTPLLAVIVNTTLLREHLRQLPKPPIRLLHLGTALPVLALLAGIIGKWEVLTAYGNRSFDIFERLLSQSRALCEYLFNILIPSLRGGGIYHDDFVVSRGLLSPWTTLPAVMIVLGLLVSALALYRRSPLFSFAVLWFFCGHLLESTVFPLELYFEHRNYLPMFGILFSLAVWVVEWGLRARGWALLPAFAWIAFAAWLTYVQAPIWGNRSALIAVWAIEHPDSPRAVQQQAADYYDRGDAQKAAALLLDAYARGIRGTDFPAQVLLLACLKQDQALLERISPFVSGSLSSGEYTRALVMTMRKLRIQVQADACPAEVTATEWLAMTKQLLGNPNYAVGEPAAYLHVERSNYYRSRMDLNSTMIELENAWSASKSPELAQLMAATLASAGLYDQAEVWARQALEFKTGGVRGLLAQDDAKSEQILRAIEERKALHSRPETHRP